MSKIPWDLPSVCVVAGGGGLQISRMEINVGVADNL